MLDRVGVLNTKLVQSPEIKMAIQNALIESSSIVDLVRLQEIRQKLPQLVNLQAEIERLQQQLGAYFQTQETQLTLNHFSSQILQQLHVLQRMAQQIEDVQLRQRMLISLNNICESIGHVSTAQKYSGKDCLEISHG